MDQGNAKKHHLPKHSSALRSDLRREPVGTQFASSKQAKGVESRLEFRLISVAHSSLALERREMKRASWYLAALMAPAVQVTGAAPASAASSLAQDQSESLATCLARGIDPFHGDRCYERHLQRQEARLARALVGTRDYLARRQRESDSPAALAMSDNRRDPLYLDRSQAAWREYVDQDCTVRAGLQWGSNVWISRGIRDCYLHELERRISFLESIVTGQFTAAD